MSKEKGNLAETKAYRFLCDNGFQVIERNYYSRFGEIDIIAIKDSTLCFVEVKSGLDYELAIQNITPKKLSKILKTAEIYMSKNRLDLDYRFDAIVVTPKQIFQIENITI